jgi:hypothetical protein
MIRPEIRGLLNSLADANSAWESADEGDTSSYWFSEQPYIKTEIRLDVKFVCDKVSKCVVTAYEKYSPGVSRESNTMKLNRQELALLYEVIQQRNDGLRQLATQHRQEEEVKVLRRLSEMGFYSKDEEEPNG